METVVQHAQITQPAAWSGFRSSFNIARRNSSRSPMNCARPSARAHHNRRTLCHLHRRAISCAIIPRSLRRARAKGELTLLELVQQLDAPETWDSILGLSFRRADRGRQQRAAPTRRRSRHAAVPFARYAAAESSRHRRSPIVGSRGCYRDCAFCSIRAFYGGSRGSLQRFRSVPNLVNEMEMLR